MTYIKNNKVLVFVIAVLLLSNIAMLYFFLRTCDKDKGKKTDSSMRAFMIRMLRDSVGFNDQQIARYEEISNKHKEVMKPLFEDIAYEKDSLYRLLLVQPSDSEINHYLDKIGEKQRGIDQRIFNHFSMLKAICTSEQRPKFDSITQNIIRGMIKFPKKGKDKDHK